MNNRELRRIVDEIVETEGLDITSIARFLPADRSNLSTLLNAKALLDVPPKLLGKFRKKYPDYFTTKNNKGEMVNPGSYPTSDKEETIAILVRQMDDFKKININLSALGERLLEVERLGIENNALLVRLLSQGVRDESAEERSAIESAKSKRNAPSGQKGK